MLHLASVEYDKENTTFCSQPFGATYSCHISSKNTMTGFLCEFMGYCGIIQKKLHRWFLFKPKTSEISGISSNILTDSMSTCKNIVVCWVGGHFTGQD